MTDPESINDDGDSLRFWEWPLVIAAVVVAFVVSCVRERCK